MRQKCLQSGMDGYLSKPVLIDALRTMLERHLPEQVGASALV